MSETAFYYHFYEKIHDAIQTDPWFYKFISHKFISEHSELTLIVVSKCGELLKYAPREHCNNHAFVYAAILNNCDVYEFVPNRLKQVDAILKAKALNNKTQFIPKEDIYYLTELVNMLRTNSVCSSEEIYSNILSYAHYKNFLSYSEQNDYYEQIVKLFVQYDGLALKHVSITMKNKLNVVLIAVKQNGLALEFAKKLQNNIDVIFTALRQNGFAIQCVSTTMSKKLEVVLTAVRQNGLVFSHILEEMKCNSEVIIAALQQNGLTLQFLTDKQKNIQKFVLHAVQQNGEAIKYASIEQQNDRECILAALKQNGLAIKYLSEDNKNNHEYVLQSVQQNGLAIQYMPTTNDIQYRNKIISIAVRQNIDVLKFSGLALQFLSDEHKNNHNTVLIAVKQNGLSLQFASNEIKNTMLIVSAAIAQNGLSLKFASDELKNNQAIVLTAIRKEPQSYMFASDALKNTHALAYLAVQRDNNILKLIPNELKANRAFMTRVIQFNGLLLEYANIILQKDPTFVIHAVERNADSLKFASYNITSNFDFMSSALAIKPQSFTHAAPELKDNKALVLLAVSTNASLIIHASERLQKDIDIINAAIDKNALVLEHIPKVNLTYENVKRAVALDGNAIAFAYQYKNSIIIKLTALLNNMDTIDLIVGQSLTVIDRKTEIKKIICGIMHTFKSFKLACGRGGLVPIGCETEQDIKENPERRMRFTTSLITNPTLQAIFYKQISEFIIPNKDIVTLMQDICTKYILFNDFQIPF